MPTAAALESQPGSPGFSVLSDFGLHPSCAERCVGGAELCPNQPPWVCPQRTPVTPGVAGVPLAAAVWRAEVGVLRMSLGPQDGSVQSASRVSGRGNPP